MWPSILSFKFFNTRSASCSTRILAFALIPWREYAVVFPSIFVNSFILGCIEDGSWLATHSTAFCRVCSFLCKICSSVSCWLSVWVKKNCSSSATSEEDVVTSISVVCTSSLILRQILSVTFNSNLERKSAALFTEPAISAILKLNCST